MVTKFIGKLLRKKREEKKYILKEISKICKKSVSYLAKLERGEIKNPSISLILNYLKALNIPYGEFFSEIEELEIEKLLKTKKRLKKGEDKRLVRERVRYGLGLRFQSKPLLNYPQELELKIKNYLILFDYPKEIVEKYINYSREIFYGMVDERDENFFQEIIKKATEENLNKNHLMKIMKLTYQDYKRALKRRIRQAKPITDNKRKKMIEGYINYRKEWLNMEGILKKYLYENGVPLGVEFLYLNKAKRYYKLFKKNKLEKIKEVDEKAIEEGLKKEILDGMKEIIKEEMRKKII